MSKRSLVRRSESSRVLERLPRHAQQLVVGEQREVGGRDRGDQADVHGLARFGGGQECGQRGLAQGCARGRRSRARSCSRPGRRRRSLPTLPAVVGWRCAVAPTPTVGQLVGAADLVGRARLLDVEHGHAQVAVVVERDLDQPLQPLVGEEALPFDVGGRLAGDGGGRPQARPGSWRDRRRPAARRAAPATSSRPGRRQPPRSAQPGAAPGRVRPTRRRGRRRAVERSAIVPPPRAARPRPARSALRAAAGRERRCP